MAYELRRRWVVPACLVVSAFAAPACEDEEDGEESGAESAPATDSSPATDSGSTATECYDIPDMDVCLAETRFQCRWDTEFENGCVPNCAAYTDEATCNDDIACAWTGDECGMSI